jgi:hypothetical protein
MHAKPDLRVFLKWMINRSGSVITAVITLNHLVSRLRGGHARRKRWRY